MKITGKSEIRLRYSTIINYGSLIYRTLVSIGFVVIVARRLNINEFGLWGIIFSLTTMLMSFSILWNKWAPRFYVRGHYEAVGASFILTTIFSILATLVYIGLSYVEFTILGWGFELMLLGIPLLIFRIFEATLMAICNVVRPEVMGYKGFVYDSLRLVFAYLFLVVFRFGLVGALFSVVFALFVSDLYVFFVLWRTGVVNFRFSWGLVVQWLKGVHVPLVGFVRNFLSGGLRAIVSWVSGSEVTVAFLNVGFAAEAPLLRISQYASPALYARALRKPRIGDLLESLRLFLLFSGFMVAGFTVLSRAIASLYNPAYAEAYLVIPVITVYGVLAGILNIYGTFISGASRVDAEGIRSWREILFSPLFKVPFMRLVGLVFSYGLIVPLVLLVKGDHVLEALVSASALTLGTVAVFPYFYREVSKMGSPVFPWKEFAQISVASLASGVYYVLSGAWGITVASFWRDAPVLGFHIVVAALIYFGALYILSPWLRGLIRSGLKYILKDVLKKFKREPYIKQ